MQKKYDYYKEYPKSRRNTVIMSIFAILFINFLLILSDFHIAFIIMAIVFNLFFIGIILNIHKNQIIIFDKQKIIFQWYSLFKSINKTFSADEINKIQFKISLNRYNESSSMHQINIHVKKGKSLKLSVIPAQYYDLMKYFKEYCEINNIKLLGYVNEERE